ncbi:MAG: glycosyltransferase family 39 protein [Candidatus Omnitrophica bacterium]|nr:glycosyltransferase family 39 protein [Candidatus Omnitrophota bacterium]
MKEYFFIFKNCFNPNKPFHIFICLAVLFLLVQCAAYLLYAYQIATFPYDVNGGEGLVFQSAYAMSQGVPVFTPLNQEPFFVMNYPALYAFLLSLLIRLFGPQLILGRLISIIAAVLSAYAIGRFVYARSKNNMAALFSAFLFVSSGWVHIWSVLVRVDMLAVMFSVWGLVLFIEGDTQNNMKKICLAAGLFIAALFSRQSSIAAPFSCLALLACRQPNGIRFNVSWNDENLKKIMILLSVLTGLGVSLVIGMLIMTKGQFVYHITRYTLGAFQWDRYFDWMGRFIASHGFVFLLSLGLIFYHGLKRSWRLEHFFFIFACAITVTAGKDGSSLNYFLEIWAAICILTGCALSQTLALDNETLIPIPLNNDQNQFCFSRRFSENIRIKIEQFINGFGIKNGLIKIAISLCLLLQLGMLFIKVDRTVPDEYNKKIAQQLNQLVHDAPGEVLLEYAGYAAINGKLSLYSPFAMTELSDRGHWDQSLLINDIVSQRFDLIVLSDIGIHYQSWTEEIVQAVRAHYDLVEKKDFFNLSTDRQMMTLFYVYKKKEGPNH